MGSVLYLACAPGYHSSPLTLAFAMCISHCFSTEPQSTVSKTPRVLSLRRALWETSGSHSVMLSGRLLLSEVIIGGSSDQMPITTKKCLLVGDVWYHRQL